MDYQDYSAIDLAMDEYFQRWVLFNDADAAHFWSAWLELNPHQQVAVTEAKQLLLVQQYDDNYWPTERKRALLERIKSSAASQQGKKTHRIRQTSPFNRHASLAVAACLSILFTAAVVWLFSKKSYLEYQTNYGETKEVHLPDGSTVQLNAHSSLRFLEDWQQAGEREVWLEGEAFFQVNPVNSATSENPVKFIVHANSLNVEVVGTAFNVNHQSDNINVFLDHGIIDLQTENQPRLRLKPGDIIDYSPQTKKVSRKIINPQTITAWKQHQIILDNQPLSDLAEILQNYYGVIVDFDHPNLAHKKVVAVLPTDDLNAVLTTLEALGQVRAERSNKYILFK